MWVSLVPSTHYKPFKTSWGCGGAGGRTQEIFPGDLPNSRSPAWSALVLDLSQGFSGFWVFQKATRSMCGSGHPLEAASGEPSFQGCLLEVGPISCTVAPAARCLLSLGSRPVNRQWAPATPGRGARSRPWDLEHPAAPHCCLAGGW